jgi:hypothetical protein
MPVLLGARIGCIWDIAAEIMGVDVMRDFESLAKWWIKGDNYNAINVLHAVVLWTLWKKRNNVCFQGECWRSVQELVGRCARTVKNWMLVNREGRRCCKIRCLGKRAGGEKSLEDRRA